MLPKKMLECTVVAGAGLGVQETLMGGHCFFFSSFLLLFFLR